MRIGIDASRAFRAQRTGTERYSLEIIQHLLRLPEASNHNWMLYTDALLPDASIYGQKDKQKDRWLALPDNATVQVIFGYPLWTHRILGAQVRKDEPDVFFVPAHVIPLRFPFQKKIPSVVTIHDLGYRYFPETRTPLHRWHLNLSTRWSTTIASEIIAVSQSTATDITKFYGTSADKISVVYEGLPTLALENPSSDSGTRRFGLERPYGLFVGTLQPRKNLVRILHAYAKLYEQNRPEWDLVLVGAKGWLSAEIELLAERLSGAVHMLGYVDDALLPSLFSGARFFCFPSLFEGFGLPILEAQHYGVPVMTSNNSSLPEVAGDAAILVDPLDIDAIADAMLRLSQDEPLRQKLIAAGYENVKRFSWKKAAQETLAVLEKAAKTR